MSFLHDLKIAVRSLARVPALWITVALTLALGIGANAAIFSVVRAVLLRPLANRDEDKLLYIRQSAPGLKQANATFSVPEIKDLGMGLKTIRELGTFSTISFTVVGLGTPREIPAGVVDGNYFDVMGLKPVLGRLLGPNDDGQNAAGALVLTYGFWRNELHSDPHVLGKVVRLESYSGPRSATVVGVLEPAVPYPVATEIIANVVTSPHHLSATMVQGREHRMTELFGRLAPGATVEQARAELKSVYAAMTAAHPEVYKASSHFQIDVNRMHDQINSKANTILWVLFAASGLLFVIASSNVANLVLARTVRRESELAVRSALGASNKVLRRALLAESLVLCVSGAIAAVLLAIPMVGVLGHYASRFSVRAKDMPLDYSLVWFGVVLAMIAAVFLAYIPRLPSANAPQSTLSGRAVRGVTGGSKRKLRLFAVTQITASFLLLAGSAVLMKTLLVLEQSRPPYDSGKVLAVNLPVMSYGRTPEQVKNFYRDVKERVETLPGVDHVSLGFSVPWRDDQALSISFAFAAQGATRKDGQDDFHAQFRAISPGFFATMGVPLTEGRDFNDGDKDGSERVVIISQSLANMLYPGQDALNRHMWWTDGVIKFIGISPEPRRIVGIVPDFDDENIIPSPAMTIYQPVEQEWMPGRMFVKAHGDAYGLVPSITRTIHQISSDQPVEKLSTLDDIRAEVLTPDKLNAIVFGGFAGVALLISVVGVAGVLAFSVSGRTREFGIRMALGAQRHDILKDVLGEGLVMAVVGVVAGIVLGFVLTSAAGRYIGELHQPGLLVFIASSLVILGAAVIASAVPANRAARVNAVEALRSE
ncbi:FtsX-like permease family protein [Acidobacteria bacterium AB60]|nr:FtsX-like permease family protein [Acidobacteria bacterium AB60]